MVEEAAFSYQFSALRGCQAGRDYYAAMVPLELLPKLFVFDDEELKPELRAQRKLNRLRIPEMVRYVLENPREYVFSALTASIDGKVRFAAANGGDSNLGVLAVPMSARFVINDGQHRRAAIEQVLRDRPEFGKESICVVLYVDAGLERSQQMFTDLNKHAVRPTRSLGVLYDHRDPLSRLACQLVRDVSVFRDLTEMDKATISNRSIKLFTLSSIYFATRELLEKPARASVSADEAKFAKAFWIEVAKHMADWQLAARRQVRSAELRREYIHAHGLALQAIAMAGADLIRQYPAKWNNKLEALARIDWSRNNRKVWEGRATIGGRVSKATNNVVLTANIIKRQLGLKLSDKEQKVETIHGDAGIERTRQGRGQRYRPINAKRRAASRA